VRCAIYTYGGHERGMGHIYQSRAIAQALSRNGSEVRFIVLDVPEGVAKLREWGMDTSEIPHSISDGEKIAHIDAVLGEWSPDVVIVDILASSPELMRYMASVYNALISLDDIGEGRIFADVLVNIIHHPERPEGATYREVNDLNYVVLRPEFERVHRAQKKIPERGTKLLVSQGGSDTFGGVVELAKALKVLPEYVDIHLVLGSAFRHEEALSEVIQQSERRFFIERDVQDMAGFMAGMDVAITGGGKTLFELAAAGVPIVAVTEEPREVETMDIVARHVLCENMGWRRQTGADRIAQTVDSLLCNQELRLAMSQSGKKAVDGGGAWRTAELIAETVSEKRVAVRERAL
jgi:UDP-2,4-diacetamido-2,4,6-trideoxy-beta-L-altropyranose hydrolase